MITVATGVDVYFRKPIWVSTYFFPSLMVTLYHFLSCYLPRTSVILSLENPTLSGIIWKMTIHITYTGLNSCSLMGLEGTSGGQGVRNLVGSLICPSWCTSQLLMYSEYEAVSYRSLNFLIKEACLISFITISQRYF